MIAVDRETAADVAERDAHNLRAALQRVVEAAESLMARFDGPTTRVMNIAIDDASRLLGEQDV